MSRSVFQSIVRIGVFVVTSFPVPSTAETLQPNDAPGAFEPKYVLVAGTFLSFADARVESQRIAHVVGFEYRPEIADPETQQPTFSRSGCEANGWDYPCYVARGRYDDGSYLSVEPTNAYAEMRPGYFVILASSGTMKDVGRAQRMLSERHVPSFVRKVTVWMGCIH